MSESDSSDNYLDDAFMIDDPEINFFSGAAIITDEWVSNKALEAAQRDDTSFNKVDASRSLAKRALIIKNNNYEKALDLLTYANEYRQYFLTIQYFNFDDDDLFRLANTPTTQRPSHNLNIVNYELLRDRGLIDQIIGNRNATGENRRSVDIASLCDQERTIDAICGDDPECYEEIMGFQSKGNSALIRLSRKVLRFVCHNTNSYIQKLVNDTIRIFRERLEDSWWHAVSQIKSIKSIHFIIRAPPMQDVTVRVRLIDCINKVKRQLRAVGQNPNGAWENTTIDVFFSFAVNRLKNAVILEKRNIEHAILHRSQNDVFPQILIRESTSNEPDANYHEAQEEGGE